jgi:uncharacterized protein with HEPN domain
VACGGAQPTSDLDQQPFLADEMILDAVLRNLELLGEAAQQIPVAAHASASRHDPLATPADMPSMERA